VLRWLRAPGSLLVATQRELILIREGDGKDLSNYAGVWTYCRRDRTERIHDQLRGAGDLGELRVQMPGGRVASLLNSSENATAVRAVIDEARSGNARPA
jgi:hypothetical protein